VIGEDYTSNKNDWHYVTIEFLDVDNGVYLWTNRAGISWTLTQDQNSPDKLIVDTDCPYYDRGFTESTLLFKEG